MHTPPPSQHDQQLRKIYSILKNKNKRKQKKKTWLKSLGSDARPPTKTPGSAPGKALSSWDLIVSDSLQIEYAIQLD